MNDYDNNKELKSLEYEVNHNSCKRIGEERFKRINQRIGFLKSNMLINAEDLNLKVKK